MESFFSSHESYYVWIFWWSSQNSWLDTSQPSRYSNGTPRESNRQDRLWMGWIHNVRELYLLLYFVDEINVHTSLLWCLLFISASLRFHSSRLKYMQSMYLICLPSVPRARWWLHQSSPDESMTASDTLLDARLFNRLPLIPYRVRQPTSLPLRRLVHRALIWFWVARDLQSCEGRRNVFIKYLL